MRANLQRPPLRAKPRATYRGSSGPVVRLEEVANHTSSAASSRRRWLRELLDIIEWQRFEAVCELLFIQAGFEPRRALDNAPAQVDLWLYSRSQPGVIAAVVICATREVRPSDVQALAEAVKTTGAVRGILATTSRAHADAITLAKAKGIHLLDRGALNALIESKSEAEQQDLTATATEGNYWIPTCIDCNVKMIRHISGKAPYWRCRNFPRCTLVILRQK